MTCKHINRIMNKIGDLASNLSNKSPFLYEELGPYDESKDISRCIDQLTGINFNSSDSMRESLKRFLEQYKDVESFTIKVIKSDVLGIYIRELLEILEDCNCYNEAVDKIGKVYEEGYNKLSKNSVSREAYEEVKRQWNKDIDDYNKLLRKNEVLEEKYKNLIDRLEESEEYREKFEEVRDGRERERINNTQEIATLRQENLGLRGQLTDTQRKLTISENKVARIEDRLDARNREVMELKGKLESLSINVNNLEKSREELLNEKVNLKNEKLESFANNSGIGLNEVDSLLRYYERLIQARKNYNPINIETHEGNINRVKGTLRQGGTAIQDIQKCCRKCEKVAKLRIELNEIRQQQFEARQEVPPRH